MLKRLIPILLALIILCSGCSSVLNRSFTVVTKHDESYEEDENSDALTAQNYIGLKNAILKFVSEGLADGVIRLYNYDGEPEEDLSDAAYEVTRNDPLGAFAVDYITHSCTRIVSYYEIKIHITFRRTLEQMNSIVQVSGTAKAKEEIMKAVSAFKESLILRISYYNEKGTNVDEIISQLYYDYPQSALGIPKTTVNVYPSMGIQRIVEISFNYDYDKAELRKMKLSLLNAAESMSDKLTPDLDEAHKALELYELLLAQCGLDSEEASAAPLEDSEIEKGLSYTAYGALVNGKAVSEGYALAYKLLCDNAGLECMVATGRLNGELHCWNIIAVDGKYYHVDPLRGDLLGADNGFLLTDEMISGSYKWSGDYPKCKGTLKYSDLVPPAAAAADVDTASGNVMITKAH